MANNNETTTRFKVDISELVKGMSDAKRQIALANAEFKAASAGLDDWSKSADGVGAKLTQLDKTLKSQSDILDNLEDQYRLTVAQMGEGSKEAINLKIKIENQKAAIAKTQKDITKYNNALADIENVSDGASGAMDEATRSADDLGDSLEDVGNSAGSAEGGFSVLKGAVATFAGNLATQAVGAIQSAIGSLAGLAEETREYRDQMNKLTSAGEAAGYGADVVKSAYTDLYGVLGDETASTTTVNNLMAMGAEQATLDSLLNSSMGIWAAYGDSIPLDGLAESINETSKVGQITGNLADALNWAGVSEDAFNESLAACTTEQERQQLIASTLDGLYGDLSASYQEANSSIIDANKANSEYNDTLAQMGGMMEPISTAYKVAMTDLLSSMLPSMEQVSSGIMGLINGTEGASEQLTDGITGMFSELLTKVTDLLPKVVALAVEIVPKLVSSLLAALPALVNVGVEIITTLLDGLSTMIPELVLKVVEIVPKIIDALVTAIPQLITGAVQFFSAIVTAIPTVIKAILEALPTIVTSIIEGLVSGIDALLNGAITLLMALVEAIPTIIPMITEALPKVITALVNGLITGLPQLLEGYMELWLALIKALPVIIPQLVAAIPDLIIALVDALMSAAPLLGQCAIDMFMAYIDAFPEIALAFAEAIPTIVMAIVDALFKLNDYIEDLRDGLIDLILTGLGNLVELIAPYLSDFIDAAGDTVRDIWDSIVDVFSGIGQWVDDNVIKPIIKFFSPLILYFTNQFNIISQLAEGCWNLIKLVWSAVATWFNDKIIKPVTKIFTAMWKLVTDKAKQTWDNIKLVWTVVSTWFNNNIVKPVSKVFTGLWDTVTSGASGAWNGIKSVFSKVASFFQTTFETAWKKVKDVFSTGGKIFDGIKDGIVSSFTNIVNAIIKAINKVVAIPFNGINDVLDTIRNFEILGSKPFDGLVSRVTVPVIPELAGGIGRAEKGKQYLLEGNGDEMVLPLAKDSKWLDEVASRIVARGGLVGGGAQTVNNNYNYEYNQTNNSPKSLSRLEIYRQTKNQFNYATGGSV